ncbi:S8 family serine peptidase [Aeromicrobium sp.]|uniref:S8 family serine peptidase n=1 Tax=Aeromicrobium sp. TaxID=1871063 RepID=UPI003D6AC0B8
MTLTKIRTWCHLLVLPILTVLLLSAPASSSASDRDDKDDKAADIVAKAPKGEPLEVVVTSRGADGAPVISTVLADTRTQAVDLVARALDRSSTIGAEMDHRVSIDAYNDTHRSQQWALDALKGETVNQSTKGGGIKVAVVDTGVKSSHSDLSGNVLSGRDFVTPGTPANDLNGHGTHVAGIIAALANNNRGIAGLAPRAKILPVRVLDRNGSGSSADVAKGIIYAADQGAKVINLSLGSSSSSTAMQSAVSYAISKNRLVVAAGGNRGCGLLGAPTEYPAAYSGVVGVGAVSKSISRSSYSSCGSWIDVVAPGDGIISTMINNSVGLGCSSSANYCKISGTSFASGYVSAAGALAIAERGWGQATVARRLESTAQDLEASGKDRNTGSGFINPLKLINP